MATRTAHRLKIFEDATEAVRSARRAPAAQSRGRSSTAKNLHDALKRASDSARRYVKTNHLRWTSIVRGSSERDVRRRITLFMRRIRRRVGRFPFCAVPEYDEGVGWHAHLFTQFDPGPFDTKQVLAQNSLEKFDVGDYFERYVTKGFASGGHPAGTHRSGRHRYMTSRGFQPVPEIIDSDREEDLDEILYERYGALGLRPMPRIEGIARDNSTEFRWTRNV